MPQTKTDNTGVWIFYVTFIVVLAAEGTAVQFMLWLAKQVDLLHGKGMFLSWVMFVIVGTALAILETNHTHTGQTVKDPILRFSCLMQRRYNQVGFVFNSLTTAPLSTAFALKQTGAITRNTLYCVVSAVLFASLWVPLFNLIPNPF